MWPFERLHITVQEELRLSQKADRNEYIAVTAELRATDRADVSLTLKDAPPWSFAARGNPAHRKRTGRLTLRLSPLPDLDIRVLCEQRVLGRSEGQLASLQLCAQALSMRFSLYRAWDSETSISSYESDVPLASTFVRSQGTGRRVSACVRGTVLGFVVHLKAALDSGARDELHLRSALELRA
jgi:hypothetical protein